GHLRHIISSQGLFVDPEKVESIKQQAPPYTLKEVYSFLGLADYYRRFIHHYASIESTITDFLKRAQIAFETLKTKLGTTSVLALPNFNQEFQVETNALGKGMRHSISKRAPDHIF
uniref:Reverse transcriptase/retrotransposon-derived protein RNase H-like domain-containing protein n=1 Tax=Solanum lycopersicum TaxID=4081 RepID=A0A3Q7JBG8_SOLLC